MPVDQILQRGRNEKILLSQAQFASGGGFVVGIKKFADRLRARLLRHRAEMIAGIEDVKPERIGRARRPQPQRVDVCATPSNDWCVVSDGPHGFRGMPRVAVASRFIGCNVDMATEVDVVYHLAARKFPGVAEGEPFVGIFLLTAIGDDLPEQSEVVANTVAQCGNAQRCHAFHETGGESAEAAVAERGVRLALAQFVEVDAEIAKRGVEHRQQSHVVEGVGEQAADQEF